MKNVVVVAPYFGANMLHNLRCFAALEDVRLGVITHEPRERLPKDLAARCSPPPPAPKLTEKKALWRSRRASRCLRRKLAMFAW